MALTRLLLKTYFSTNDLCPSNTSQVITSIIIPQQFTEQSLDLIERDLVVAAIIELGRARALVRRHLLRVFEQTAVEQIDGDAGRPEAVTADPGEKAGLGGRRTIMRRAS